MIDKIAEQLYQAYINGKPLPIPSTQEDLDENTAYEVQKCYAQLRAGQRGIAGYKAAMTNPAARAKFGADKPLAGVLYTQGVLSNGACLLSGDYQNLALETELVYFAASDIAKPLTDISELSIYFKQVAPGIEVANANFTEGKVSGNDIICVNTNSTQVIVGVPQDIGDCDLNKLKISFYHNGELAGEGHGSDALECQYKCLLWLVNKVLALGYKIKRDDIFFTGALGQILSGKVGQYHADFGKLGAIAFKLQ